MERDRGGDERGEVKVDVGELGDEESEDDAAVEQLVEMVVVDKIDFRVLLHTEVVNVRTLSFDWQYCREMGRMESSESDKRAASSIEEGSSWGDNDLNLLAMALGDGAVVDGVIVISLQVSSGVIAVELDIIGDNKFEGGRIWRCFFFLRTWENEAGGSKGRGLVIVLRP